MNQNENMQPVARGISLEPGDEGSWIGLLNGQQTGLSNLRQAKAWFNRRLEQFGSIQTQATDSAPNTSGRSANTRSNTRGGSRSQKSAAGKKGGRARASASQSTGL